jgi:hypothetical protein
MRRAGWSAIKPDERADTTAIHFDQKPEWCLRGCCIAPPTVRYRR